MAPGLSTSPYVEAPFAFAGYVEQARLARTDMPLYKSRRKRMAPLRLARRVTGYWLGPPSDYPERAEFMDRTDKAYRDDSIRRGVEFFREAPYHENLPETRRKALAASGEKAKVRAQVRQQIRNRELGESKIAIRESYKHDLYHFDEMFSKKFKSLRIVPVNDRRLHDGPLNKLPLI
jgi:hypothetical protein